MSDPLPKGSESALAPRWDATNSVRLCANCEDEQGISAGADARDYACAACGQHDAPYVYPALSHHESVELARDELRTALDGMASRVMMFGGIQRSERGEFWIARDDVLRLISEVRDAEQ